MKCDDPEMLSKTLLPANLPGKPGYAYGGRCAGGAGRGFGGQYLIIAANDDALGRIWEALEGVQLDKALVYDASAIGTAKLEKLIETPLQGVHT